MKRGSVGVWALLGVLPVFCGCQVGVGPTRSLTPSPTPFLLDLPVPRGFRLLSPVDDKRIESQKQTTTQEYVGWADRDALRDFYRSEMPLVRWRALDGGDASDRYLLLFDRGHETCRISIRSAGVFSFGRAVVVAQIARRAEASDVE